MSSVRSSSHSRPSTPAQVADGAAVFPHERLDVHRVLVSAYETVAGWPVPFTKGSAGDPLRRAVGSALLRYAEGDYAQGGCQTAHGLAARASCGEAAAAAMQLVLERRIDRARAESVRRLLARAMAMLHRLSRRS
jgi:hypothetical protein